MIYQIGLLWNPIPKNFSRPFVVSMSYTPKLSEKRNSEWRRNSGVENSYWHEQTKRLFEQATFICAITKNAMNSAINDYGVSPNKICAIGPGISASGYEAAPDIFPDYDSKRILFIGKGFKGKGLDTLISAFKKVRFAVPDATLTVVGPSQQIEGEGIEYLGRIFDRDKIKELYYKSSIFVMPSIFEPVGQVFLEAMSCQLPCIGTTLDAMPELIDSGKTGYTIAPGNSDELAEKLIHLLQDPDLIATMGKASYNKLENEFRWDKVGKKFVTAVHPFL